MIGTLRRELLDHVIILRDSIITTFPRQHEYSGPTGRWYVGGSLGAATGLDLCSAFTPGFSTTPGSCDKSEVAGKLGGFAWSIYNDTGTGFDHNENGISFAMGADVKYDITNRVGIRFEWKRFWDVGNSVVGSSDVDMFTLGGLYRF